MSFYRIGKVLPSAGGFTHFGFGKSVKGHHGMARSVVRFLEPPKSRPLTVCFEFPNSFLTHKYVIMLLKERIRHLNNHQTFRTHRVVSVQFEDRNVKHGTRGLQNRWLITLSTAECRDYLLEQGVILMER